MCDSDDSDALLNEDISFAQPAGTGRPLREIFSAVAEANQRVSIIGGRSGLQSTAAPRNPCQALQNITACEECIVISDSDDELPGPVSRNALPTSPPHTASDANQWALSLRRSPSPVQPLPSTGKCSEDYRPDEAGRGPSKKRKSPQLSESPQLTGGDAGAAKRRAAARKEKEKEEKCLQKRKEAAAARERKAAETAAAKAQRDKEKGMQRKDSGKFAQKEIKAYICGKTAADKTGWEIMRELQAADLSYCVSTDFRLRGIKTMTWKRMGYDPVSQTFGSQTCGAQGSGKEEDIPYVLLLLTAEEFVSQVETDSSRGILRQVAAAYPGFTAGMLIIGLRAYITHRERTEYRQRIASGGGSFNGRQTLDVLPLLHTSFQGLYHRVVVDEQQAAEHVKDVTIALAKQPYEDQKNFLATFGMGHGKPQYSSDDSTLCKALCQIQGVSAQYGRAVGSTYRSLGSLLDAYDNAASVKSKQELLVGLQSAAGARKIGATISSRVFEFLTCDDPDRVVE